jgi:hypothetical protein
MLAAQRQWKFIQRKSPLFVDISHLGRDEVAHLGTLDL